MKYHLEVPSSGFTLIEMLVSLALFTIIATMSVGTLLVLINGNTKVVQEQVTITSLSFALDSMTREIRTGSEYYCGTAAQVVSGAVFTNSTVTQDCPGGEAGISFRESGSSLTGGTGARRVAYFYQGNTLWRKIGSQPPARVLAEEVNVTAARFVVTGSSPLTATGGNTIQPTVTITLVAKDKSIDAAKDFTLQTTVTQRSLDI